MAFARRDPVKVRLDAKAFTKLARRRAQSHTARVYSVFLVTERIALVKGIKRFAEGTCLGIEQLSGQE